jgi:hypothetical protein
MGNLRQLGLAGLAAFAITAAAPAHATLQLTLQGGASTFSCADGASCDSNPNPDQLTVVLRTLSGVTFFGNFASSQTQPNVLSAASFTVTNTGLLPQTFAILASQTDFLPVVSSIDEAGSGTWTRAAGSDALLRFWADTANTQGANPLNHPGPLLGSFSSTAVGLADSFSKDLTSSFVASSPFSMTEEISGTLIRGGSLTGFSQTMVAIPEPSTWAMMLLGFAGLGYAGFRSARKTSVAIA